MPDSTWKPPIKGFPAERGFIGAMTVRQLYENYLAIVDAITSGRDPKELCAGLKAELWASEQMGLADTVLEPRSAPKEEEGAPTRAGRKDAMMLLDYERLDDDALLAAIRLQAGEHLLVLQPWGWHLDGVHIPNACEHFSREGVCEDHKWEVVCEYGPYIAVVKTREALRAAPQGDGQ